MTLKLYRSPSGLHEAAWKEFGCEPVPKSSGRKESRRAIARRERVDDTVDKFLDLMASDDPPKSEAEVIAQLVPVSVWLMSWLFRQLAIQLLKFCWKKWSE
jgi:hypothetical protein